MASISDEDQNIPSETGRKTRSGRKPSINVPVTPTRATRRSSRRGAHQEPEPEPEAIHDEIQQNIIEELQEEIEQPESIDDDKSSSFPYGQYNEICGPTDQASDSIDNLLANLAEDNANSLPSTGDDTEFNVKHQFMQQSESNDIADDIYGDIQSNDIDCPMTDANTEAIAEDLKNGADSEKTTVTTPEELIECDHVIQEASNDAKDTDNQTNEISKKRKIDENYDPGSPTTESSEIPEKKLKEAIEEKIEEQVEKRLPELDKYWKAVKDDPTDFTGWTYLLQYVDQENNIIAAREAYDAFLSHYPYCYGYWRKYADYEKRKGDAAKCEEVFERGLKAIPLSVDLWIHYLNHVKTIHTVDTDYIRTQFERAIEACGLEFRSDKLWDAYIKWETEAGRITHVVGIYDRLLATPTQGYNGHFYSFQELVSNNSIQSLLQSDEIQPLLENIREEINQEKEQSENIESETGTDADQISETEITAIKDKILSIRRRIHKQTVTSVTARWTYEEGIKRPYFHVKPLERCQLKNWKDYLDFEIEQGDLKRTLVLFERCLIACALYDEFWLKLIRFLESKNDPEMNSRIRDAFERACKIHHPDKPSLHLMWSAFEECQNNIESAAEILTNLDALCPNLLQVAYRRVNLERRRGNLDECDRLYNHYIENAKNKNVVGSLAIKYARFLHKIRGNLQQGYDVLKSILEKDNSNTRVALQMIDLALQRESVDENEIVEIIDKFMTRDGIEPEQRVLFAQRKVEFLEDFGSSAKGLQEAQRALHSALAVVNELKKKANETSPSKSKPKEAGDATAPQVATTNATAATNYNYNYNTAASASNYYGNTANAGYQAYGEGYNYNQWQQFGSNYSGYGQWSGYGSNGYY